MSNPTPVTRIATVAAALVGGAVSVCLTALLAMGAADFLAVALEPGKSGASTVTTFEQPVDQRPTPRPVTWDRLEVGDCYDHPHALETLRGERTTTPQIFTVVSCGEPHQMEVFAHVELTDEPTYPGNDAVVELANLKCFYAFQRYVGMRYAESGLDYIFTRPDELRWASGDRSVICSALTLTAARIEGTVRADGPLDGSSDVEPVTILHWTALDVGDCYDDASVPDFLVGVEPDPAPIVLLPCREPHHLEVVGKPKIRGEEYPGDAAMAAKAEEACDRALLSYVGPTEATVELQSFYLHPTEETWNAGLRRVVCSAVTPDYRPRTGSVQAVEPA